MSDDVLHCLMPSCCCKSHLLGRAGQQLFGHLPRGLSRVRAIESWLYESIDYLPGFSNTCTTAQDMFVQRVGVCCDFAHLGITLCRALNIPARLVVGYVNFGEPPQDFHAVFEACLGEGADGRWVFFDGTQMDRLIRTGGRRDTKAVSFATVFGSVQLLRKDVTVDQGERFDSVATQLDNTAPTSEASPTTDSH